MLIRQVVLGNMLNKPKELGTERVSRLLLKYALPSIVASVVMSIFNILDCIFIGHSLGTLGLQVHCKDIEYMVQPLDCNHFNYLKVQN